jgi:carbamoyl-phosphate synthase small subunit
LEAILMLLDGSAFRGRAFGAAGEVFGEVVFNTSITGYQEIISDPSYRGQIVTLTYPHIGNYGVNEEDIESGRLFLSGLIVREYSKYYSNWRGNGSLEGLLRRNGVIGISEIDTRALTRRIRERGAMTGVLSTVDFDRDSLLGKVRAAPAMLGADYVTDVTCEKPWLWRQEEDGGGRPEAEVLAAPHEVVVFDFGVKYNILRELGKRGCRVIVVPAAESAEDVLARRPHGLVLSNGPGDPAALPGIVAVVRELMGKVPILGVCLGHQLLGHAFGGRTYKLPFGHHGGNHPVKNLLTGKIEITAQNHGFAVDPESLPPEVEVTHLSLFDGTVEGMRHRSLPVFSVQYHPESSPGPHDSGYLFDRFFGLMSDSKVGDKNVPAPDV